LHSFELHGKQYEIWSGTLADPRATEIWKNMQILVLLYIDGASPLELDEAWSHERWSLHLLYEVTPLKDSSVSPYTLVGFSTSHRYWIFPTYKIARATKSLPSPPLSSNGDTKSYTPQRLTQDPETFQITKRIDTLDVPSRERISQFLILPPYQGQSLGARLYQTVFGHYVKMQNVYEIPVEDPSEEFDAMRDYSDIAYLRKIPAFKNLSIATSLPPEKLKKDAPIPRDLILGNGTDLEALRYESKIVPRQFNRMVELHLLSTIPPFHRNTARITRKDKASNENDRKYYLWRLALKDRIYRQNADVLDQLEDASEKVDKLEAAVDSQLEEYVERLEGVEKREQWTTGSDEEDGPSIAHRSKTKRKRVVEEDEEDGEVQVKPKAGSKKPKK
jgi:histone acetyltransferase 1